MTDDERNERIWDLIAAEIARCMEANEPFDPERIGMTIVDVYGTNILCFPDEVDEVRARWGAA